MRFSSLGVLVCPWEQGEDPWLPAHCELEWSIYQSVQMDIFWRPEMNEGLSNQSSSILVPRWTRICYWDVGISAKLSLLSLLLLLYTHRWVYAERLITQLSGQECNWAMQFHSVGWILIEYTQQERHSVDGWTQSEYLDRYWWFILRGDTLTSQVTSFWLFQCTMHFQNEFSFFPSNVIIVIINNYHTAKTWNLNIFLEKWSHSFVTLL